MQHKERKTEAPAVLLHRGPALSTLPEEGTLDPEVVEERWGGRNAGAPSEHGRPLTGKPLWASAPGWRRDAEPLHTASRLPAQRDGLRVTGRGNPLLTGCSVYTYNPTHTYPRNPHLSLRRRISAGVSAEAEGEGKNVLEPLPRSPCFQAPDVGGGVSWMKVSCREPPRSHPG